MMDLKQQQIVAVMQVVENRVNALFAGTDARVEPAEEIDEERFRATCEKQWQAQVG
jgi:hypothetical protein